jgi:two-component system response regulator CpxR
MTTPPDPQPCRVLIVDDEGEMALTLAERLALRGLSTEVATTAAEAIEKNRVSAFHVAVLDVKMPGMDGFQLMKKLREDQPGLRVILFSGAGSAQDRERALHEGATEWLVKPFDIEALTSLIQTPSPA